MIKVILPIIFAIVLSISIPSAFADITTLELYSCDSTSDGGKQIHKIDPTDGTILSSQDITFGVPLFDPYTGCIDLASDPTDGQMYMIATDDDTPTPRYYLVTIDPETGDADKVGQNAKSGFQFHTKSFGFDINGQIYATQLATGDLGAGIPEELYVMNKETGSINQFDVCTFNVNPVTDNSFFTLNYDTEQMIYINGDGSNVYYGIMDETFAGGSCESTSSNSDYSNSQFQTGLAYDTVTGLSYFINDNTNASQDFVSLTGAGVTNEIGTSLANGLLFGLAFAIDIPPVVTGSTLNITVDGITFQTATDEYTEFCTATDNDPANPVCSVQSGSIDTTTLGLQTVTYEATDILSQVGTATVSTTVVAIPPANVLTTNDFYSCSVPSANENDLFSGNLTLSSGVVNLNQQNDIAIAEITTGGCLGLDQDPTDGTWYAIMRIVNGDGSDTHYLVTLDPTTGVGTNVATLSDGYQSMAFNSTGNLFMYPNDQSSNFYQVQEIDKTNGSVIDSCDSSQNSTELMLAYDYTHEIMYGMYADLGRVSSIDISQSECGDTSAVSTTGELGTSIHNVKSWAWNTDDEIFYGISSNLEKIYQMNPLSGVSTLYGLVDGFNPVPPLSQQKQKGFAFILAFAEGGDTTPPVVSLVGSTPVTIELNIDTYSELGATCLDDVDGQIDGNVVIGGDTVDESTISVYTVDYDCQDTALNSAITVQRVVNVVDTTIPSIVLTGSTPVTIELNIDTYTELGAVVSDNDPTVTTVAVVGGDVVDESTIGVYTVTYNGDDPSSNSAIEVTRTVNVVDTTNPSIVLNGETPTNIQAGVDTYSELGAVVSDNDPTVTTVAVIGGDVIDESTIAVYIVTYNGDDPSSNSATEVTRTVNVIDTIIPLLTLVGSTPIVVNQFDSYSELGATCFDAFDGQINGNVVISGDTVDTNTVGTYRIYYDCDDASTNSASQIERFVSVVDAIMPLISPILTEPITLFEDSTFSPMNYVVCNDAEDGEIVPNGNFSTDGGITINTANRGTQFQDYTCTDAGSNVELQSVEFIIKKESGAGSSSFSSSSAGIDSGSSSPPPSLSDIDPVSSSTSSLLDIPTLSFDSDIGDGTGTSITDLFSNLFSGRLDSSTGERISLGDQVLNSFSPEPSTTGEPSQGGFNLLNAISDSLSGQSSGSPASDRSSPVADFFRNLFSSWFG